MSAIFKPEPLTWEDIDGGLGEAELEMNRTFINDFCYPDEPVNYPDDEQLPNDLCIFRGKMGGVGLLALLWEKSTHSKQRRFFP